MNRGIFGESASANLGADYITGPQASGCRLPVGGGGYHWPPCPPGSDRIVFYGLLGPDALSITYRKPNGGLASQRTVAGVGAYLLVFPYNPATCAEYNQTAGSAVRCDGKAEAGASPVVPGAVTQVTYTHGRTCGLTRPARLEAAYRAFTHATIAKLGPPKARATASGLPSINAKWLAAYQQLLAQFLARQHLTLRQFRDEVGPIQCPAVGWVASTATKVTAAEVATPVNVRQFPVGAYGCPNTLGLPDGCNGVTSSGWRELPVEWSFRARLAVTSSRSWYEWSIQTPPGCGGGGGESFATDSNIHTGQILRYSTFLDGSCHGTYRLTVGFMAQAPPGQDGNGFGGFPGHDGSILIGRASITSR